jgi:transposase
MTLPYSDAYFVSAYPRECTETFQAGHVVAFEFFGGVPVRTSYENVPRNIFRLLLPGALCGR